MSYTPKNHFIIKMIETGVDPPVYAPENNSNLLLKRTGVGEVGFNKKLLADVACCDDPDYQFYFGYNPETNYIGELMPITIKGGCPPFNWSVSGSDFGLEKATTTDRSNNVGVVGDIEQGVTETVTVTDACETSIECLVGLCRVAYDGDCCSDEDYEFYSPYSSPLILGRGIANITDIEVNKGCPAFTWITYDDAVILGNEVIGGRENTVYVTDIGPLSGKIHVRDACWKGLDIEFTSPGTLWRTGYGAEWGLGLGNSSNYTEWATLGETNVIQVVSGSHTHIIKDDGTLWGCGQGSLGQLGLGDNNGRSLFTQVGTDTDWAYVAHGVGTSYAIKTNGGLWSCGWNWGGELGLGDTDNRNVFTSVPGMTGIVKVDGGYHVAFAIKRDATIYSAGRNDWGCKGAANSSIFQQLQFSYGYSYYCDGVSHEGTMDDVPYKAKDVMCGSNFSAFHGAFNNIRENVCNNILYSFTDNMYTCGNESAHSIGFNTGGLITTPSLNAGISETGDASAWHKIAKSYHAKHILASKMDLLDGHHTLRGVGYNEQGQMGTGDEVDIDEFEQLIAGNMTDVQLYTSPWSSYLVTPEGVLYGAGYRLTMGVGDAGFQNTFLEIHSNVSMAVLGHWTGFIIVVD